MSDNLTGLLSPFLRNKRIRMARPYFKGSILDYGCGVGLVSELVPEGSYVGVDIDRTVLNMAKASFPQASFYTPDEFKKTSGLCFDTIIGLAIIEHMADPLEFLTGLIPYLKPDGQLVLTTPHPLMEWVLQVGGKLGLFAKSSHEEHKSLLDRSRVVGLANQANLDLVVYKRFLFGANQLIVLKNE